MLLKRLSLTDSQMVYKVVKIFFLPMKFNNLLRLSNQLTVKNF